MLTLTKKTKADPEARKRLTAGLKSLGYRPIGNRSKQYEALESPCLRFVYFVGRDGELRMSRSARLSDSMSIRGLDVYQRLLDMGQAAMEQA